MVPPAGAFDFTQASAAPALAPVSVYSPLPAARKSGLLLTPLKMLLLTMLVMFGMGLAFTGGLLLGLFLKK